MAASESLIFDGNRVQEEQEEELKQEEDERQQQLKDLLANAFDDIDADETCSFHSDDSHDSGRHSDEISPQNQWNEGKLNHHASTPVSESRAPPLITPMIQRRYSSPAVSTTGMLQQQQHNYCKQNGETMYQEPEHTAMISYDSNLTQQSDCDSITTYQHQQQHQQPYSQPYSQQRQMVDRCNGSYPSSHSSHHSVSESNPRPYNGNMQHSPHSPLCHKASQEHIPGMEQYPYSNSNERHLTGSSDMESTVFIDAGNQKRVPTELLQDLYFKEGAGAKNTQMGILYQAKSRQLQELQEKYELHQLESSKELRILRHEVALLQGSKQGCESSLKQTQALLTHNKEARFELQKKLDSLEDVNNNLAKERDQLREDLASAEASIESLNTQIFALGSTDTVERMREQHESIVNTLRTETETEAHELHQQIANIKQQMLRQNEALDSTKLLLKADMEAIAKERLDHAETVNRLTNSLKESQRQIQELLDEACGTELSKVRIQLKQCSASKMITEQLCDSLQREIRDLKEQVSLYESAHTIQSLFTGSISAQLDEANDACDDTLIEFGFKQSTRPTRSNRPTRPTSYSKPPNAQTVQSSEETILILRRELQKCLSVVKEKRAELSALRSESDKKGESEIRVQTELQLLRERLERTQLHLKEASIELNLYKSAAKDGNSLMEVKLQTQIDSLTKERAILQDDVKCLTERLGLVATNEAKLEEINVELNSKISEMADDFDLDKKAALDRCQETLESHNQTVREMLRSELETEFQMRIKRLESQYKIELNDLRKAKDSHAEEIRQLKELYVQICSEKTALEAERSVQDESVSELQKMIQEVETLKQIWSKQELEYKAKLIDLESGFARLEHDKITLSDMVDEQAAQLESCRREKDIGRDGSSQNSSALAACRELFSNSLSTDRTKSNNQSLDRSSKLSANSSRAELSQTKSLEEQLRNEKKERADMTDTLLKTQAAMGAEKAELHTEINQLQQQLSDGECRLEESRCELARVNKELSQMKVILGDVRCDNQKLDKLLSAERVQLSLSRDDAVTLQNLVSELKLKVNSDDTSDRFEELRSSLDESKKSLVKVKAELEAETVCHTQAKEELCRLRSSVSSEKEAHCAANKKLCACLQDLQTERKSHQLTKTGLDRKGAELQAEITSHNQTKIDIAKLRADLSEMKGKHKDLVEKSELVKVQGELESEKLAHDRTRTELGNHKLDMQTEILQHDQTKSKVSKLQAELSEEEEKRTQLVDKTELVNIRMELESERKTYQLTKAEVDKKNTEMKAEISRLSQLNAEVTKLRAQLSDEKDRTKDWVAKSELASTQAELQSEKRAHEVTKADLKAEISQLSHLKADVTKLRTELSEEKDKKKDLLERSELVKVQMELESEKRAHDQSKQRLELLESSLTSEKSTQSLAKSTLASVQSELIAERSEHCYTQQQLVKLETDLQTERANHGKTKIELVTLETELATERFNQGELRQSLERVKSNHGQQEVELQMMRTRRSQDEEFIGQLKTQRKQEKSQLEGLKASHNQVLSDLNDAKAELVRKLSDVSQQKAATTRLLAEIDSLKEKHRKEKERLVEQHKASSQHQLEEAKRRWSEELSTPALDIAAENKMLKEKLNSLESDVLNYEKLLSQADEHFEQQLIKIRVQMEEEHRLESDKLNKVLGDVRKSVELEATKQETERSQSEREAKELQLKINSLSQKVTELNTKCKDYQSCAEDLRRNLKSMSAQTDLLKSTNKKLQSELAKSATAQESKVDYLASQLQGKDKEMQDAEHEHSLTVQSLKQKMIALKNEQVLQQTKVVDRANCECQTASADTTSRQQYDLTIQNIRADVLTYVEETNRNAAKLIKCEIHKAKQVTARQLRNYYVKCFKQSLYDNRSTYEEKLCKLERTLDNAVAAAVTPSNINTDSILSVPEQLFTDSLRYRAHSELCSDHSLSQVYSRGPTPIVSDGICRLTSAAGRMTPIAGDHSDRMTSTTGDSYDRATPVVTDTDSRYSYVPLRHATISSSRSADRNKTPVITNYTTPTSDTIIRELGLHNTETSPPRWYNPPPEKLDPSPEKHVPTTDNRSNFQLMPVKSMSSKR